MQKLGLTNAERKAFHTTLRSSHTRRIIVRVLDLDGSVRADLSDRVLDGEVVVDGHATVTRSLSLSLLDPRHTLNFDTDSPDDGALYADRMLEVVYSVYVPDLSDHVNVRVFTGPVTKLDRKGDVVDVEAQGKEALAMGEMWRPLVLKKGTPKTAAIRMILKQRAGETRFDLPDRSARLLKTASYDRWTKPWKAAKAIARSMDLQLFYDGRGVAILRHLPRRPVYTFNTGTGGEILSDVAISNTMEEVVNTVVVRGGKPKGAKEAIQVTAVADRKHPLSPWRLGRTIKDDDGTDVIIPRHHVERIEDGHIRSVKEARKRADRVLDDRLTSTVDVTLDVLPLPHLDPGDKVRVVTDDLSVAFRVWAFTIPLSAEGSPVMSLGYHKKTTINRRRIRRT